VSNIQAQIMNLPCSQLEPTVYRMGHRDARHAAAELVGELEQQLDELFDVLEALCLRIDNEGASPLDWHEYDAALVAISNHAGAKP